LLRHRRTHLPEKPFRCGDCGRGHDQVARLSTHQRAHTGERPFRCAECHKSFTTGSALTQAPPRPYPRAALRLPGL
ncbi:ZSCA2 protein, partial [Bucorvus abyssinicus]|nr:ZSCA2 protein [Bucorvus abyssinicus]